MTTEPRAGLERFGQPGRGECRGELAGQPDRSHLRVQHVAGRLVARRRLAASPPSQREQPKFPERVLVKQAPECNFFLFTFRRNGPGGVVGGNRDTITPESRSGNSAPVAWHDLEPGDLRTQFRADPCERCRKSWLANSGTVYKNYGRQYSPSLTISVSPAEPP